MKKTLAILVALVFSACNDFKLSNLNPMELLSNPDLISNQAKCIKDKDANSCIKVADELAKNSNSKENLDKIKQLYNLACSFGSKEGCVKLNNY
ncbi:hypothetical protein AVBRAN12640_02640 [Campylobacter sp. RM12640]|uniref:hypothetical protein n=1 Tax=unclassified Campylobacter TaxID=2593542 RepID=UPI001BD99CB6|nr:hypothetical protein [Campylobacter sp. 2018MI01]MBZ7979927.1 hypothetical protein [Campylobacter sp. RM12642]MBZ7981438.1 hypothetical protein [Campylobacter sp. RM12640]MBZ7989224.1 hypothetical protein [Campylobacter sp. RM12635]MBZ8007049.1 hypothetical protein [Campylobacter sp. RM9334]MBT0877934.1 hypothetical protein [Campylobacter sp. 2018MI01]